MKNIKRRLWTDEEIEIAENLLGVMTFDAIGAKIGRTGVAVELKLRELGSSSTRLASGLLTANELRKALHVENHMIHRWRRKFGLSLRCRNFTYITPKKRNLWFIHTEEFWKWAYDHQDLVDFNRIEPRTLLPEPEWLEEAKRNNTKKPRRRWTQEEDDLLLKLYYAESMTQREVSEVLDRTYYAIGRRLIVLKERNGYH
jgi:hypothetical protein